MRHLQQRILLGVLALGLLAGPLYPQQQPGAAAPADLVDKLKAIPGVVDVKMGGRGGGINVVFEQPLDHQHPELGKFQQQVYISHLDYAKPVILSTEGYAAGGAGNGGELRGILGGANVVTVEHRYFGNSKPNPTKWEYLTVKNAADDMHAIVAGLKKIYTGKWVATGASKGGQTSLFYKSYYPDDVDATVAYVAPVNIGQEDPRINEFIATVGDEATRKKIKDFQIAMFKREDELLPLCNPKRYACTNMTIDKAYEYGVLELPYAYWQYGTRGEMPAPDAPAQAIADYYNRMDTIRYYCDAGKKQFEAFLYQAFTEIGYYNYDTTDFKQYMKALKDPTNLDICPDGTKDKIVFNANTMAFVFNFLQYKANNVIYVYGETDAWSATQMQLLGRTNAFKIVVKDRNHNANIRAMSPEQKTQVFDALDKWMDMKVVRN